MQQGGASSARTLFLSSSHFYVLFRDYITAFYGEHLRVFAMC